jgi:hypothetical protein
VNTARGVERLLVGRSVMVLDAQSRRRAAACETESVSRGRVTSGVVETTTERVDGWMDVVVVRAKTWGCVCAPVVKGASLRRDVYFT